jgi:AcrR family transcriptional regulator
VAQKTEKQNGRPRQFDPDVALRAATMVFWRKGYLGTSLDDLTDAMGINRPSLYATFGNKESLFLSCIDLYDAASAELLDAALAAPKIGDALDAFFTAGVEGVTSRSTPSGCLIACSLVGAAEESDEIKSKLKACMASTDAAVRRRLRQAIDAGELPANTDVAATARMANCIRHGLALRARAGESRRDLVNAARVASRTLFGRSRRAT